MQEIIQQLQRQLEEYDKILNRIETFLSTPNLPSGTLRIAHNHNTSQYYYRKNSNDKIGSYITKSNINFIKQLAQKSYEQDLRKRIIRNQRIIRAFLEHYDAEIVEKAYTKLNESRRKLICPYVLATDEFVAQWQQQTYTRKEVYVEEKSSCIYTEKGEVVRSKSEKIIADKLFMMQIPYHYEKPLLLRGFGTIYPDFTVLNKRTRKEYYYEHLGMMDHPDYSEKAIKKIESYERNNIFQGEQLLLTYETQEHHVNTRVVERLIRHHLL